jgi:AraC-like DNA-binding protein
LVYIVAFEETYFVICILPYSNSFQIIRPLNVIFLILIYTTLLNIAIFQGIVLGTIILKSPLFKSKANTYLALAIFTLSLLLLNLVFEIVDMYSVVPYLRFIDNIEWAFIFPVFIFLFIVHQVQHPVSKLKNIRLLFLPFLLSALLNIFYDLDDVAGLYTIPSSFNSEIEILFNIHFYMFVAFIAGILIYTYTFIKFSSNVQERKWIKLIWLFVFLILFPGVMLIFIYQFLDYDVSFYLKIVALFATFLIHWTSFYGIFKYRLAKDKEGINELLKGRGQTFDINVLKEGKAKGKTNIDNKGALTIENPYFKELEALCNSNKIYRDSSLNRERVAKNLGISTGYLSQIINEITGENFTTYINKYRVEAVKEMILDSDFKNYSLLSIGLESGFPSKSTFYKAFKKVTGMTPNSYRKAHK